MLKVKRAIRTYGKRSIYPVLVQGMRSANTIPSYPGGMIALKEFIIKNLSYPETARKAGISGIVEMNFVINNEGRIENIRVMRGLSAECNAEAMRVTGMITGWIPAVRQGKPVDTTVRMPVEFFGKNKSHPAVIRGRVFERHTGEPVEGVFVIIKDTNTGCVTLPDGSYRLEIPAGCKYLQCFGVGYSAKEIPVANHSVINIELDPECMTINFAAPEICQETPGA